MQTRHIVGVLAGVVICAHAWALGVGDLSNTEATGGLKEALIQGASAAVGKLGVQNGFFGNDRVRIPLPAVLERAKGALRLMGMQGQVDELELAINRAAEAAVPEAKALLVNAVRNMSVQDAKGILTGGDTAATEYFRKSTSAALTQKFLPIVTKATSKVGLAEKYNQLAGRGAQFGLVDAEQAKVENYVTQKALDGLFLMIAEQEKAIRKDPLGAASSIVQKVFGAIGR